MGRWNHPIDDETLKILRGSLDVVVEESVVRTLIARIDADREKIEKLQEHLWADCECDNPEA